MLPVAILAGGLATRLHPLSQRVPKALLPIVGRPFIFHQLDLLQSQGIEQVVICIGHLGEQIEAAVGDGSAFGLQVRYSSDGAQLLGTGGALRQALPLLGVVFELAGAASADCQLFVEGAFLGAPTMRATGKRVALSGPTGREPLIGLRFNVEPTNLRAAAPAAAPARPSEPAAPTTSPSPPSPKARQPGSGRVRVFRSRPTDDQPNR